MDLEHYTLRGPLQFKCVVTHQHLNNSIITFFPIQQQTPFLMSIRNHNDWVLEHILSYAGCGGATRHQHQVGLMMMVRDG